MRKTLPALYIIPVILLTFVLSSCFTIPISDPIDSDKDGIPDNYDYRNEFTKAPFYDKCPATTPPGAKVDGWGCPVDTDMDGVPDYFDKCPDTPAGVKVDKDGCPLDSDKDGVPNHLDKCPYTPLGVKVNADGCPFDTDKDGISDNIDKCPGTPPGAKVDKDGCPLDTDKDGVSDYLDKCPDTPPGVIVDQDGCSPKTRIVLVPETDGKVGEISVATAAGAQTLNKPWESTDLSSATLPPSAPKVIDETEVKNMFKEALAAQPKPSIVHIIYFKSGSAALTSESLKSVQEILEAINSQKSSNIMALGYTDTVASAAYNRKLSQRRAKAVADALVSKGVQRGIIEIDYFGKEKLLVPTPDGVDEPRNRRVEIIVR